VATWDMVREIMAAFPGTEPDPPGRMPAVRVKGKLVALMPDNDRSRPEHFGDDDVLVIRTGHDERAALIYEDPHTFAVTPHYQTYPGVLVRLATVRPDQLRELLAEAWRMVAPKRLIRELDQA
jgi:hypothetical protein